MIFSWGHHRRFNAYSNYFRKIFGERVQKLSIDAGFTCPNRDGTLATGGCTYCNNDAFNPSYCNPGKSIKQQIREGIEFHKWRYKKATKYLAYFQPYSNTYAPPEKLKMLFNEALSHPDVIGLVIGTRPDCIDKEKLEYFRKLSDDYYIILEYGIESCYNKTLERINRQHTFEQSVEAIEKTAKAGIRTGVHIILGLPGESREEMLNEADIISSLPLNNIKFHQLQIFRNTPMANEYRKFPERFNLFGLDEYIHFIVDFVEKLNPQFVIERFAGEVPPRFLAGPGWGLIRNEQIIEKIELELTQRDTWQGKLMI
jgi:radical SAM protein (TIGR01212 family)